MKDIQPFIDQAKQLQAQGFTQNEIAEQMGKSPSSVALYLNPDRLAKHREDAKAAAKKLYAEQPEKVRAARLKWSRANPETVNQYQREHYQRNIHHKRAYLRAYYRSHRAKHPNVRIANQLRAAFWLWYRRPEGSTRRKAGSLQQKLDVWVGCTQTELRAHLEGQFTGAMSWITYGTEWEVDHIQPLSTFDLTKDEEIAKAMRFTNVRPLHPKLNRGRERREFLGAFTHLRH